MDTSQGRQVYKVQVQLQEGCLLKSARAYLVLKTLEELGDIVKKVATGATILGNGQVALILNIDALTK